MFDLVFLVLQKTQQEAYYGRKDHLSPPVSSRGHSDSDISEFDVDERFARSVPGKPGQPNNFFQPMLQILRE